MRENHLVQFQIGEAEARLRSARGYVEATADRVWQEVVASGELTIPQRIDIRMAATFAIDEAKAVADAAWEVAGASAIFASSPFERRFRDHPHPDAAGRRAANRICRTSVPTSWAWSRAWRMPEVSH